MKYQYYIDESGNTGDLSKINFENYFVEQRVFGLACIGCPSESVFFESVLHLKKKHRIQGQELKSSEVYKKPRFAIDLINLMSKHRIPLFVELVDKYYFLVANMVDRLILPPAGAIDLEPGSMFVKSIIADYMAINMPLSLVQAYTQICRDPSYEAIRDLYQNLIDWAENSLSPPKDVAESIVTFARDSFSDFVEMDRALAMERSLPIPDKKSNGSLVWILPNLTSFTNIYARINRFSANKLEMVTIFHDEQLQFGDILANNKKFLESSAELNFPKLDNADYKYTEIADLKFINSKSSLGIQISDVLAGFLVRALQDKVWNCKTLHPDQEQAYKLLTLYDSGGLGVGINYVMPKEVLYFLGLNPRPNFTL